jgi:Tol biopolymer transport system component
VRSLEGGEPTRVASAPEPHSVTWSPDGSKLAYAQGNWEFINIDNLGNVAPSSIWIVDLDGGTPVQVTDHPSLSVSPAWLPDGRHLLFISDRDGPRDIYAVRVDGAGRARGEPVRVTTGLDPHTVSVSADGSTVAYSQLNFQRNVWEIAIPETGSVSISQATPVTEGNQVVESLGLSADGRWLGFDSNIEGNQDIYLMSIEGGEPRPVTRDPGDDFHPDFSPDGSEIVFYSNRHGSRDLFLISADGGNEARLTDDPGEDFHPSFSPDGLRITFSRAGPDAQWESGGIYVMSRGAVGGEWSPPEQLSSNVEAVPLSGNAYTPRWSPDGNQIVYRHDAGSAIGIVSLEGQVTILLEGRTEGFARVWQPEWSSDGRFVYFLGTDSSGTEGLYLIPVAGGTPRELVRFEDPTRDVFNYALGDGKVYLSVAEYESDIWVMDLEMK